MTHCCYWYHFTEVKLLKEQCDTNISYQFSPIYLTQQKAKLNLGAYGHLASNVVKPGPIYAKKIFQEVESLHGVVGVSADESKKNSRKREWSN